MRITLWSPGMASACPTRGSPVGWLLSNLPFVDSNDGYRLHRSLARIFETPGEHDHTRTFMLHLLAQNSRVLIEMVATHVLVTESEPVIVLTGQQGRASQQVEDEFADHDGTSSTVDDTLSRSDRKAAFPYAS